MKVKVKYDKCKTCENAGWSMPQCAECNRTNAYKYYRSGRPLAPNGLDYLNPEDMEALEKGNEEPLFLTKRFNLPTSGSSVIRPINRESLWQFILDNYKAGLYGDLKEPETMLRYWKEMAAAGYPSANENVQYFESIIESTKALRSVEREARWKGAGMGDYYCSLCQHTLSERTKFCPECGAKMDEREATDESKNT